STLSWPPPFYFWPLFFIGQFLNFRVYQLLGEAGTYYGVRFGKNIPWVTEFPFVTVKDPQKPFDDFLLDTQRYRYGIMVLWMLRF
nr:phosphatidyl-N-methylethanolamine N-methyltransferase [Tanacetum cinerariifolium]